MMQYDKNSIALYLSGFQQRRFKCIGASSFDDVSVCRSHHSSTAAAADKRVEEGFQVRGPESAVPTQGALLMS